MHPERGSEAGSLTLQSLLRFCSTIPSLACSRVVIFIAAVDDLHFCCRLFMHYAHRFIIFNQTFDLLNIMAHAIIMRVAFSDMNVFSFALYSTFILFSHGSIIIQSRMILQLLVSHLTLSSPPYFIFLRHFYLIGGSPIPSPSSAQQTNHRQARGRDSSSLCLMAPGCYVLA